MATLHFTSANDEVHQLLNIDMTKWHTWGVIWTPTLISYVVDGKVWGTVNVASDIPDQPMTLDLQQQTWCSSGQACPLTPQSTQIDWVAEYEPSISGLVTVGPFSGNSVRLSDSLKEQVAKLARTIVSNGDSRVTLVGYSNRSAALNFGLAESRSRASNVAVILRRDLVAFHDTSVTIKATGRVSSSALVPLVSPSIRALSRVVSASIR
jgi:outer membrane protein OmpA-like peptidoglycan-associated protein